MGYWEQLCADGIVTDADYLDHLRWRGGDLTPEAEEDIYEREEYVANQQFFHTVEAQLDGRGTFRGSDAWTAHCG